LEKASKEVLGQILQSSLMKKVSKYFEENFEFLFKQFEPTIFFEDAKFPGSP
jgi:hypothetical protein